MFIPVLTVNVVGLGTDLTSKTYPYLPVGYTSTVDTPTLTVIVVESVASRPSIESWIGSFVRGYVWFVAWLS